MATLLEVRTNGKLIGRCDERCYDAIQPECTCICGGHNHGAGHEKAIINTEEFYDDWLARYAIENRLEDDYEALLGMNVIDKMVERTGFDMSKIADILGGSHG